MWSAGERPRWVQHAIDGEAGPVFDSGRRPFDPVHLRHEAELRAGCDDWRGDSWREPLDIVCQSLEDEVDLHVVGRWRAREVLLKYLENRLRIAAACRADPSIPDERIHRPVIVTGSPRAGTSIMHQLLSLPTGSRAPLAWEYFAPAPPPRPHHRTDDPRIDAANSDVRLSAALAPQFDGMHEQGALLPREDGSALGVDLRSDVLVAHYGVPSFRRWLARDDMRSGYEWLRLTLQVLQRHIPTDRWVLKWPTHVNHLPQLLEAQPDALIVVCHRDPVAMLSSVTSLIATLRWAHAHSIDMADIAAEQVETFLHQCDRLVELHRSGALPDDQVVHVRFDEFVADQRGTVVDIHDRFGIPLALGDTDRLDEHLLGHPQGRHGGHAHSPESFGFDVDSLVERTADYCSTFGIVRETA